MGNKSSSATVPTAKSIFEFTVDNIDDQQISLSSFAGKKAYIVVNVASKWGLTKQNYKELQMLYESYNARGLEIIAFPWWAIHST